MAKPPKKGAEKSTRKQTIGTRRGNGPGKGTGKGGPATGAGLGGPRTDKPGGRPLGVKNGEGAGRLMRAVYERNAQRYAERLDEIALDPQHPLHVTALLAIQNKLMPEKMAMELTGKDGGPIETEDRYRFLLGVAAASAGLRLEEDGEGES